MIGDGSHPMRPCRPGRGAPSSGGSSSRRSRRSLQFATHHLHVLATSTCSAVRAGALSGHPDVKRMRALQPRLSGALLALNQEGPSCSVIDAWNEHLANGGRA